jgi:multisubunit Na+/H+ antiporter MnhE subunit
VENNGDQRQGSGSVMTISSLLAAWLLGSGYLTYQALFGVGGVLGLASLYIFSRITPVRPPPRPHQSFRDTIAILGV